jgi:hypothetical protein
MMPLDCWRLGLTLAALGAEAQMVIALRMMGLWGVWALPPGEQVRMVSEKQAAIGEASIGMANALLRGASAAAVVGAGASPVRRRVRSNARRLARALPGRL